jgi:hypothetical protein
VTTLRADQLLPGLPGTGAVGCTTAQRPGWISVAVSARHHCGPEVPQQDDLAVRVEERGAQCTEPGALSGVDWSLAVLAGIWRSGRREDGRWRHRCPPSRAAPPPGSAAALIPRTPVSGCGWRPLDSVGPWPTGVCTGQSASVRHVGRNAGSPLGGVGGTSAWRVVSEDRDDPGICMSSSEGRCSA